jgi:hypothetical protein
MIETVVRKATDKSSTSLADSRDTWSLTLKLREHQSSYKSSLTYLKKLSLFKVALCDVNVYMLFKGGQIYL